MSEHPNNFQEISDQDRILFEKALEDTVELAEGSYKLEAGRDTLTAGETQGIRKASREAVERDLNWRSGRLDPSEAVHSFVLEYYGVTAMDADQTCDGNPARIGAYLDRLKAEQENI